MSIPAQITSQRADSCEGRALNDDGFEKVAAMIPRCATSNRFSELRAIPVHAHADETYEPSQVIRWWGINE